MAEEDERSRSGLGKWFDNWVDNYNDRRRAKYGSYFGGGGNRNNSPDSGSSVGTYVEPEPLLQEGRDPFKPYWKPRTLFGAGAIATEALNRMDRSEIPSSGGGGEGLGLEPNTEQPTTGQTQGESNALYFGGNKGWIPQLSYGKNPPPEFFEDSPSWMSDAESYLKVDSFLENVSRRDTGDLNEASEAERALQEVLAGAGFDPGSIDGFWGGKTDDAIARFKRANDLGEGPELDDATREALRKTAEEMSASRMGGGMVY